MNVLCFILKLALLISQRLDRELEVGVSIQEGCYGVARSTQKLNRSEIIKANTKRHLCWENPSDASFLPYGIYFLFFSTIIRLTDIPSPSMIQNTGAVQTLESFAIPTVR